MREEVQSKFAEVQSRSPNGTVGSSQGRFDLCKPYMVQLMEEILHHLECIKDLIKPVNNGIFTISTGAGFQPSTVGSDRHCQTRQAKHGKHCQTRQAMPQTVYNLGCSSEVCAIKWEGLEDLYFKAGAPPSRTFVAGAA